MAYYEAALQQWSPTVESLTIATRVGSTHILATGPSAAPPLLLFHGLGDNALLWRPLFAGLRERYRLYAPDIPGQPGRSASVRLSYGGATCGEWLQNVINALAIVSVDLIGLSLGGFLALRLGALAPLRVGRILLLSPAGMAPVRFSTMLRLLPVGLFPSRASCRWFMQRHGATVTDQALEWAYLMSRHYIPAPPPLLLPPDELQRVTAPVSILVGQHDLFFSAEAMLRRARHYLPDLAATKILPGAGHNLVREKPDIVQAFALSTLER